MNILLTEKEQDLVEREIVESSKRRIEMWLLASKERIIKDIENNIIRKKSNVDAFVQIKVEEINRQVNNYIKTKEYKKVVLEQITLQLKLLEEEHK